MSTCTTPPRNIQYSDEFYMSQSWYLEESYEGAASLGVIVDGVPIGGEAANKDWTHSGGSLTEDKARQYIEKELSNYKAQIAAEAFYVICQLSLTSISTLERAKAYDAIVKICELALGRNVNTSANANKTFALLPLKSYIVIRDGQKREASTFFRISNLTGGELELRIEELVLPKDLGKIKFADKNPFKIKAFGNKLLTFDIKTNDIDQNEPISIPLTVSLNVQEQINSQATIEFFPSINALKNIPLIEKGTLNTNAHIECTAPGRPNFEASNYDNLQLPYFDSGPTQDYAGEGYASVVTSSDINFDIQRPDHVKANIYIRTLMTVRCGSQGTGGLGTIQPKYRTIVSLPDISSSSSWTIYFSSSFEGQLMATFPNNSAPIVPVKIYINELPEKTCLVSYNQGLIHSTFDNLRPGIYTVIIESPNIGTACFGGSSGTVKQAPTSIALQVDVKRHDKGSINKSANHMDIDYKCLIEVLPNLWHHNLLIDSKKMVVKEGSPVPASKESIIQGIKDGIFFPSDGWVKNCPK